MRRLTDSAGRIIERVESRCFGGDVLATLLGFIFFVFTVGFEKLNPRNVAWLTFNDQKTHLLGWYFFAADQWRWPLGSNPMYGWEGKNSIVYTDSWPGMALVFKTLNLEPVNQGQYFGFGFLVGALALFVGARRLFWSLGLALLPSLIASGLLGTTAVFWWMQRWYPALSAGLAVLVWALYFYVDDPRHPNRLRRRWSVLLVLAAATHAYLTIVVIAILGSLLWRRLLLDRRSLKQSLINLAIIGTVTTASMYVFGYFTVPSKWAQTGGYGWYASNVLGLIDSNEASRFLPDVPSLSGQYEPTALGLGTLLLLFVIIVHRLRSHTPIGVARIVREHAALAAVLLLLGLLAISNTVSIADSSFTIPLPQRVEHGLSIFRSSARFMWPTLIVVTVTIIVLTIRQLRHGVLIVALALIIQIVDSTPQARTIALLEDGNSVTESYDESFWSRVPTTYTAITSLPAQSLGFNWESCAFAAAKTGRTGECGYFSRVQGLEAVNRERSSQVLSGKLENNVIYMVSRGWLESNRRDLDLVFDDPTVNVVAAVGVFGFGSDTVFLFPACASQVSCSFLGSYSRPFDASIVVSG